MAQPADSHVLIVEDEEANIQLLERALRSESTLWVARSLAEAHAILRERPVNVVVSDHRLPDGRGTELLEHVAKHHVGTGRVLVTAYGDSKEVVAACDAGIIERFFLKPYSPLRLKSAVLELMRRRGAAKEARVLVVDDDADIRHVLRDFLASRKIGAVEAADGEEALALHAPGKFDLVLLDVNMPKLDGFEVLARLVAKEPELPVILMTAADSAIGMGLLEAGAFDLIGKPLRKEELFLRVERAIWTTQQLRENRRLLEEVDAHRRREKVVAESSGMKLVLEQVNLVAKHQVNVLVTGETGTGKEVVARLLHKNSPRHGGPFIPVNCGAIPDNLIESQLFGHEKGAFTDAKSSKPGFFESAHGGTLFLDEVGELSLGAQVRLLRALEHKEVTRVGSTTPTQVDVRVIAATHRDLEALVAKGDFREDLFYRLNGFTIRIPPLRERTDDIPALMQMAAADFCGRNGLPPAELGAQALKQARAHRWPGNVRELLHVIERSLITRGPARIDELDLPAPGAVPPAPGGGRIDIDAGVPMAEALDPIIAQLERQYLTQVLRNAGGKIGKAATLAGIHRKSLYNKLKRHGIDVAVLDEGE